MTSQKDQDFINQCFETLYQSREPEFNYLEAKQADYTPEDRGVPPEMAVGEVNQKGYVKWKMLGSTLDENEIAVIENQCQIKLSNLFRAYFTTKFHLFDQVGNEDFSLMLPSVPIDNPLGDLLRMIEGNSFLIKRGFIPFGLYQDGWGVVCLDVRRGFDENCPIVWFDHETADEETDQESLEKQAQFLLHSFEELMSKMFL